MSYCRLTDSSDVYAFQSSENEFVVVVANSILPSLSDEEVDLMGLDEFQNWARSNLKVIGGRFDGEIFEEANPKDLFCRLRELLSLGYRVEPDTWAQLDRHHPELGLAAYGVCPRSSVVRRPGSAKSQ